MDGVIECLARGNWRRADTLLRAGVVGPSGTVGVLTLVVRAMKNRMLGRYAAAKDSLQQFERIASTLPEAFRSAIGWIGRREIATLDWLESCAHDSRAKRSALAAAAADLLLCHAFDPWADTASSRFRRADVLDRATALFRLTNPGTGDLSSQVWNGLGREFGVRAAALDLIHRATPAQLDAARLPWAGLAAVLVATARTDPDERRRRTVGAAVAMAANANGPQGRGHP